MTVEVVKPDPRLKAQIHRELMAIVYGPAFSRMQSLLDPLIHENGQLEGDSTPYISFRGRTFAHGSINHSLRGYKPPLKIPRTNEAMRTKLAHWSLELSALEDERTLTGTSLTAVLNAVVHLADLYVVIPQVMHGTVETILAEQTRPPTVPLPPEQLALVQSKHGKYLTMMKHRMMRNLID